ncbi:MAG TPA: Gx transporter family protein, partial [Mesotoga infera]|nr:Gx transporter family protein [Mesotoga infera]
LLSRSRLFGMAGVSLAGAAVSNLVQLFVAAWLIVRSGEILYLYPYMLLLGSISALINAYIAHEVIRRIGDTIWFD